MQNPSQTAATGDYQADRAQFIVDHLVLSAEQRAELIAEIADEKFKAKLAANDPVNFIAAMESFAIADAPALLQLFLTDAAAFRALLVARMVELVREDAEMEAVESLERSERLFSEARLEH